MYLVVPGFVLAYVVVVLWATNGRIAKFCRGHLPIGTNTNQIRILKATYVAERDKIWEWGGARVI